MSQSNFDMSSFINIPFDFTKIIRQLIMFSLIFMNIQITLLSYLPIR